MLFLFGLLLRDGADWRYRAMWAHDRAQERRLFEDFVDLVHERLARDPGMHIYHYGVYEKTAITELMGIYATREDAVDDLLRREVFEEGSAECQEGRLGLRLEPGDGLMLAPKKSEYFIGRAVSTPDPDLFRWLAQDEAAFVEVGVLRDDCKVVLRGVTPDGIIVGSRQINLANVSRTRIEVGESCSQTR